jgi:photosystem II Psb28-2 protein
MAASVQFIDGIDEEIGQISLRQRKGSSTKIVVLTFNRLRATEQLRGYTNKVEHLWLRDDEGEIQVSPGGMKFTFIDDDTLANAECSFEVDSEENFDRVMRFFHRYADEHGFEFQES